MELSYGLGLLSLGLIATVGFFWVWFKIQTPAKKKENDGNDVLTKSGFLGDDTV